MKKSTVFFIASLLFLSMDISYFSFWKYEFKSLLGDPIGEPVLLNTFMMLKFNSGLLANLFVLVDLFLVLSVVANLIIVVWYNQERIRIFFGYVLLCMILILIIFSILVALFMKQKLGSNDISSLPHIGFYAVILSAICVGFGLNQLTKSR